MYYSLKTIAKNFEFDERKFIEFANEKNKSGELELLPKNNIGTNVVGKFIAEYREHIKKEKM